MKAIYYMSDYFFSEEMRRKIVEKTEGELLHPKGWSFLLQR